MKSFQCFVVMCAFSFGALAQSPSFAFGTKDRQLQYQDPEMYGPLKDYVVIGDFQSAEMLSTTKFLYERKVKMKILSSNLGPNLELPIIKGENDKLTKFKARVYKRRQLQSYENLEVKSFNQSQLIEEDGRTFLSIGSHVAEGEVFEYEYALETKGIENVGWNGSFGKRVLLSEYYFKCPYFFDVTLDSELENLSAPELTKRNGVYVADTLLRSIVRDEEIRPDFTLRSWSEKNVELSLVGALQLTTNQANFNEFVATGLEKFNLLFPEEVHEDPLYEKYRDEDAIVYYDIAENNLAKGRFTRKMRIEVLTKGALHLGDFQTPVLFGSQQYVEEPKIDVSVISVTDGMIKRSSLDKDDIFRVTIDKQRHAFRFTAPNVKVGSIIDVEYTIEGYNLYNWTFQWDVPVGKSEYKLIIPNYVSFTKQVKGTIRINYDETLSSESPPSKIYTFTSANVPPFELEPYTSSANNYRSQVSFNLTGFPFLDFWTDWEVAVRRLNEWSDFGGFLRCGGDLKKEMKVVLADKESPAEILEATYDYVRSNFTWNERLGIYADLTQGKFMKDKSGGVAEINLLMVSILREAGLTAHPVVLRTRNSGVMDITSPRLDELNYVLCSVKIGEELLVIDATEKNKPMNLLPERALNGFGMKIGRERYEMVPLKGSERRKERIYVTAEYSSDGSFSALAQKSSSSFAGYEVRSEIDSTSLEDFTKKFADAQIMYNVSDHEVTVPDVLSKPVKERFKLQLVDADPSSDKIIVDPFLIRFTAENPFSSETRSYPVSMPNSEDYTYTMTLKVPENMVVSSVPQSEIFYMFDDGSKGSIRTLFKQIGNNVQLTFKVTINKDLFLTDEYPYLRSFYDKIIKEQSKKIVLSKI